MGEAVWEFIWLLDKVTRIDGDGGGLVLGGKPINLRDLSGDLGVHDSTVSRSLKKLREEGYIYMLYTPYGIVIKVWKAKKIFGGKLGKSMGKTRLGNGTSATRSSESAGPNIRQYKDNTVSSYRAVSSEGNSFRNVGGDSFRAITNNERIVGEDR
jgi:DNA-binding transcriptional ArsR family regulator